MISWAHGTMGISDRCAPSHYPNLGFDDAANYLRLLLISGYAVVATDYIGLGTPGVHTYMSAIDQGNAVADIVPAARRLNPYLSATWFVSGHSQGGAAALDATRAGEGGEIPAGLAGTIAIAPGNSTDRVPSAVIDGSDRDPFAPLLDMYVLIGAAASDPRVQPNSVLSAQGKRLIQTIPHGMCLLEYFDHSDKLPEASVFSNNQDAIAGLEPRLARYGNPDSLPTRGPVLVVTGDADTVVPAVGTFQLIYRLRHLGSEIDEVVLPGQDHMQPLLNSLCLQLRFLNKHGGPTPRPHTNCVPSQ